MAVSVDFYNNVFGGVDYPDLDRLLTRAESEINCFILRAPETEEEMRQFDLAVCAEAEYMGLCGGVEAWSMSVSGTELYSGLVLDVSGRLIFRGRFCGGEGHLLTGGKLP